MNCPFCKSEPIVTPVTSRLRTRDESSAKNIRLIDIVYNRVSGRRSYYVYEQTQYIVKCSNKKCLAYHLNKRFWSPEEALAAWDRREI